MKKMGGNKGTACDEFIFVSRHFKMCELKINSIPLLMTERNWPNFWSRFESRFHSRSLSALRENNFRSKGSKTFANLFEFENNVGGILPDFRSIVKMIQICQFYEQSIVL